MDWFNFSGTVDDTLCQCDITNDFEDEKPGDQQPHFDWLELWPDLVQNNPSPVEMYPSTPSVLYPSPVIVQTQRLPHDVQHTPELSSSLSSPASSRVQTPSLESQTLSPFIPQSPSPAADTELRMLSPPSTPPPIHRRNKQIFRPHGTVTSPLSSDENCFDGRSTSPIGLESPFSKLGLCSPKRRTSTTSPSPLPSPSLSPPSIQHQNPLLESKNKRNPQSPPSSPRPSLRRGLSPPSPGWMPDTPTPARFYAPLANAHHKGRLIAPRQPIFDLVIAEPPLIPGPRRRLSNEPRAAVPTSCQSNNARSQDVTSKGDQEETKIHWIAHQSTDGGLSASLRRLRSRMKTEHVSGVNMFFQSPRKRFAAPGRDDLLDAQRGMNAIEPAFRANSTIHAVHTANLLSGDVHMRRRSKESIVAEMRTAWQLGIPTLIIHLGSDSYAGQDEDRDKTMDRMRTLITDLDDVIRQVPGVTLAIENTVRTSRSPRTSLTTLASISLLLTHFPHPSTALCLDLTHLHLSELDLNDPRGRKTLFELLEQIHGKIRVVHVGDSCTAHGGRGERHASGHLDISSIRAILRHPLLRGIPTQLETPLYYRGLRQSTSSFSKRVSSLESTRASLERDFMQEIVNLPDDQWAMSERVITKRYFKEKKLVEDRIYKIMEKMNSKDAQRESWTKWRRCRKREVAASRKVQGMKRRKGSARAVPIDRMRDSIGMHGGEERRDETVGTEEQVQVKVEKV
ncbi:hypothetical protein IAU59_001070 [Kwoniella sp. CBS 9459]